MGEPEKKGVDNILEVKDLKVWFPVRKGVFGFITGYIKAVDGISFNLKRGETLGVVGESGCGKSTTSRAVLMLNRPTTGTIKLDGESLDSLVDADYTANDLFAFRGRLSRWQFLRNIALIRIVPFLFMTGLILAATALQSKVFNGVLLCLGMPLCFSQAIFDIAALGRRFKDIGWCGFWTGFAQVVSLCYWLSQYACNVTLGMGIVNLAVLRSTLFFFGIQLSMYTVLACIPGQRGLRNRFGPDPLDVEDVARFVAYRRKVQVVFQDPQASLNPRHTVMEILTEGMVYHGLCSKDERREKAVELLEAVGMPTDILDRYPHEFSGGQRQRLCIARAIALKPELLICDEAVSALDLTIRAQVLDLLGDLKRKLGLSMIFITHDIGVVQHVADRIIVMNKGRIVEEGTCEQVLGNPREEYTKYLMASVPKIGKPLS